MNTYTRVFVLFCAAAAIAAGTLLFVMAPTVPTDGLSPVIVLCAFALIAEALAVWHPNSVYGSIGFIPYLSAIIIVPNWIALAGALVVRSSIELISRRALLKGLFNISQQALTFAIAVHVFLWSGGESLQSFATEPLARITLENGLPAILAFVASFAVNTTLVSTFIALNSNRRFSEVWHGTHISTIGLDILASPIVFLFAWVYVRFGPYAATALWLPVLGLRQLHKNNLDLERNNSELLELMVKSMEARDPYTSGHSRRVQQFSIAIARGLGLSPANVDKVSRAALLHDVGKIHEKYAPILRKPGGLTPEEWQTMQLHPVDGAELVSTMSKLHDIVPSIRHHHERWDGTGYPEGLAGEMIPQASRIIAFADTIDAMTSERPYRRALTESEVRSELVRCRGTQFDPVITDRLLSNHVWRLLFPPPAPERVTAPLSLVVSEGHKVAREA